MTGQKLDHIAPPPSLDDILSAGAAERVGSVDFTSRLAPEAAPSPEASAPPVRVKALTRVGGPDATARTLVEVQVEEADVPEEPAGPVVLPVAHLEEEIAVPDEEPLAPEPAAEEEPVAAMVDEAAPEHRSEHAVSVDAVAATVIARMRSTEDAARRHLESIEAEAARRCELVTAQAELDAELIRLHARREAHAIITAARMRAGGGTGSVQESQRLHEIGETFSRFAESLETTVASAPGPPDRPQKP